MSKLTLDSVEWKKFKIKDIFKVETVKGRPIENYEKGRIPYVSTASINNAIINFINGEEKIITKGATITVDPIKGSCFFHDYNFIGRGLSGASVNVLRHINLNKFNGLFICSAIQKTSKLRASYGYLFNSNRLKNGTILLPIDNNGNLNWQFMEDYIKQEMKEQSQKIINYYENKLLKLGFNLLDLEVEWKEFFFTDIFKEVKRGKRLTKANQKEGNTPYVSSTALNNGIDNFISNNNGVRKYKNNLSIANSGSVGSCFYHKYEYIASDHITTLTCKNADENIYKFMSTIIKRLENKYSFNREINDTRILQEKIILPIDRDGNPHWEYMSKFIQNLEVKSIKNIVQYIYIYIQIKEKLKEYDLKNIKWKEYFIEEICDISSGKDIYEKERIEGKIPYITSTSNNNGIGYFISNTNETLDEHIISVNRNGSVGYSFYHTYKALFGNDTRKLKLKYQNEFVGKFISFMLLQQREKYGYGYKMGTARLKRQKIMLPSNINGNPNYDFMEKYMIIQEIKQIKKILDYYNF